MTSMAAICMFYRGTIPWQDIGRGVHARDVATATRPAAKAIFACIPSANEYNVNKCKRGGAARLVDCLLCFAVSKVIPFCYILNIIISRLVATNRTASTNRWDHSCRMLCWSIFSSSPGEMVWHWRKVSRLSQGVSRIAALNSVVMSSFIQFHKICSNFISR